MERPRPSNDVRTGIGAIGVAVILVIDSAGKVRSVEMMGNPQWADEGLLKSTSEWKFIPAFSADRPVASRIFLGVP